MILLKAVLPTIFLCGLFMCFVYLIKYIIARLKAGS